MYCLPAHTNRRITMGMYLVGGAVRDFCIQQQYNEIHRPIGDLDVAVVADSYAQMEQNLVNCYGVDIVHRDPSRNVIRGRMKVENFGNQCKVTNIVEKYTDSARGVYTDFKWVEALKQESEYISIVTDLSKRDLTINAMAISLDNDRFIDVAGGLADIKNGVLGFTGSPADRIVEDYLRVVRIYRFMAVLNSSTIPEWKIVGNQLKFMQDNQEMIAAGLSTVSKDRIFRELQTLFRDVPTLDAINSIKSMPERVRNVVFDKERRIGLAPSMRKL